MSTLRRILVDGGSGAGKTTFARRLCDLWQEDCGQPVQLVSLDFFYPGWHGLEEASRMVVDDVLTADSPGYTPWDWKRSVPLPRVALDPRLLHHRLAGRSLLRQPDRHAEPGRARRDPRHRHDHGYRHQRR